MATFGGQTWALYLVLLLHLLVVETQALLIARLRRDITILDNAVAYFGEREIRKLFTEICVDPNRKPS